MGMLDFLTDKRRSAAQRKAADALYAAAIAQARQPAFYAEWGVPDTLDGRFDLLVLHVHLLCRRLAQDEAQPLGSEVAQKLFDAMFTDMDRNLREMGVGDPSIPRKIKAMIQAFYGRRKVYDAALAADDAALTAAVARNIFNAEAAPCAHALAAYARRVAAALDRTAADDIVAGRFAFPPVGGVG